MKKLTLLKTLLAAVLLLVGGGNSAWANDAYFGEADKECGAWDASSKSKNYILQKGGTITLNFTFSTNTDTENYPTWQKWYTWLIDVSCNGWQFACRADNEAGSNWHGTLTPTITYSDNFETVYTRDNMSGASVVLEISRSADNEVTVLATTTKDENSWWKKEVITLGDGAGDNDMTFYLTCDNGYGEIHSVVSDNCVGTLENVTEWWNNFSDYFTINANKTLTLNFKNYSNKANNWNNFVTVITNDYNRGAVGYAEEVVLRVDNYGWGTYYNNSNFSNNYNWTSFANDMDGANVELKIRRLGTKVAVKATYTTTSGQKYFQQYVYTSPSGTDPMRVFLTADQSHITNLTSSTADTPAGSNEYLYNVKAIDDSDNELQAFASGSYWTGEDDVTVVYPYAIKPNEYWYTTSEATYATTINASNTSVNITYTKDESIVGFYEGETASGNQGSYSNGAYGTVAGQNKRDRGTAAGTLPIGMYQFIGHLVADGNSGRQITLREGTNDPMASLTGSNHTKIVTEDFTVYATTGSLYINGANSGDERTNLSTSFDYVLIKRIGDATVSATLDENGYATFASPYALDLTTTASLKAYKAAAVEGNIVRFTELNQTVPANTGVLLEGTESATVSIPVVASGDAVDGNIFQVNTSGTTFTGYTGYTYFGLLKNTNPLTFATFNPSEVAIPASKAYLKIADTAARELRVMFDDETAITGISEKTEVTEGYYDLSGRRVAKPTRGLYIVNGKKVVIK